MELNERDAKVVEGYKEKLLGGQAFRLVAISERSRYGYKPPINRRSWAHVIETLGKMAKTSDRLAQVAANILGRVNLYGTDGEERAHVYEAAEEALARGYTDVIGRAGPEAGRWSDHQHEFTLHDRVALMWWLEEATQPLAAKAPGVGWCLQAIAEEIGYYHPTDYGRKAAA